MLRVRRILARARRREWLTDAVARLGGFLALSVLVSVGLVLLDRRSALEVVWWVHLVAPVCALAVAGFVAWVGRPSRVALAMRLDDRLGLKDRLSTAVHLEGSGAGGGAFAEQVLHEAEEVSGGQPVGRVIPWRFGWGWRGLAGLLVVLGLVVWLTPVAVMAESEPEQMAAGSNDEPTPEQQQEDVETARLLSEIRENRDLEDAAARDDLLTRVAEMVEGGLDSPDLREEAEAVVSDLERDLAAAAEREQQKAESLQNDLSRLELPDSGEAVELAEALRRGDFQEAVQALRHMEEQLARQELDEGEREELAKQIDELAEQLEQMAEQQQERSEMAQEQMEQMLEQAGFSEEQVQQMREGNFDPETMERMAVDQLAQQLRQEGESMEQARERARQMAQQMAEAAQQAQQQSQQQGENSQSTQGMSDALRRLSQAVSDAQGQSGASAAAQQQAREMGQSGQNAGQMSRDQRRVQEAMDRLANFDGGQSGQGSGQGGNKWGVGDGGQPTGPNQTEVAGYETEMGDDQRALQPGRVITSWGPGGGPTESRSRLRFDATVQEARDAAERAVAEDRVPRRYHRSIQRYFEQLPQQAPAEETVDP